MFSPNIFTTALWRNIQVCAAFPVAAAAVGMFIISVAVTVVKRDQHNFNKTQNNLKHFTNVH